MNGAKRLERTSSRTAGGWWLVVALCAFLVALTTASMGLIAQVVFGAVVMLWMLSTVAAVGLWGVRLVRGRARNAATAAARTSVALLCVLVAYSVIFRFQSSATRERGDAIAREIEIHRAKTATYPTTLGALYGPEPAAAPRTCLGWADPVAFRYERTSKGEPRLWYPSGLGVVDAWMPERGWRSED